MRTRFAHDTECEYSSVLNHVEPEFLSSLKGNETCERGHKIARMLDSGFTVEESYIQFALKDIQAKELSRIFDLKLWCSPAVYLMGVPDPTGSLDFDEIYIATQQSYPEQQFGSHVLVTRFPLLKSSAIRKFRVASGLKSRAINNFFTGRHGVIVFSTSPTYPSHAYTGGDFDGDLYLIIGQKDIVNSVNNDDFASKFQVSKDISESEPVSDVACGPCSSSSVILDDELICASCCSEDEQVKTIKEENSSDESFRSNETEDFVFTLPSNFDSFKKEKEETLHKSCTRNTDSPNIASELEILLGGIPEKMSAIDFCDAIFWEFIYYALGPRKFINVFLKSVRKYTDEISRPLSLCDVSCSRVGM